MRVSPWVYEYIKINYGKRLKIYYIVPIYMNIRQTRYYLICLFRHFCHLCWYMDWVLQYYCSLRQLTFKYSTRRTHSVIIDTFILSIRITQKHVLTNGVALVFLKTIIFMTIIFLIIYFSRYR